MLNIKDYWKYILEQNPKKIREFFHKDAIIKWHNTKEVFNVKKFISINCKYPGKWAGNIEKLERINDLIITVVNVYEINKKSSFHAVSFIKVENSKIISIDEYWGEDANIPDWRLEI
ncbi:hypothetical protein [Oceanivirga salmonicida]|uniref:hypothetical protein n=1 Tax=Oceanivirga salmonicida TaxID=1769291 RepID=UPI000832DD08|nr:hypothetical protein [Oceanivirga salmonicida]